MSPGPVDPSTEFAVGLAEVRAEQRLLQREVATNIQNLTSATDAMQAELRHVGAKLEDVAKLQLQQVNQSEGLQRAFKGIEDVARELKAFREQQSVAFDAYREAHGRENQAVADRVTHMDGRFRGIWMAGALVAFLGTSLVSVAWLHILDKIADQRQALAEAKAERVALESRRRQDHDEDINRHQRSLDALSARLTQLEATRGAR